MAPSRFIVMEGPDGSGTTTHAKLLAQRLKGNTMDVVLTAEPSDGEIGTWIRSLLKAGQQLPPDALQLLFCADRAHHISDVISPALRSGLTVICDRYSLSSYVYGSVQGLDEAWLRSISAHFPEPDITIITLPPFSVAMERIGSRKESDFFEEHELQKKIHERYASSKGKNAFIVDTSKPLNSVADEIASIVEKHSV